MIEWCAQTLLTLSPYTDAIYCCALLLVILWLDSGLSNMFHCREIEITLLTIYSIFYLKNSLKDALVEGLFIFCSHCCIGKDILKVARVFTWSSILNWHLKCSSYKYVPIFAFTAIIFDFLHLYIKQKMRIIFIIFGVLGACGIINITPLYTYQLSILLYETQVNVLQVSANLIPHNILELNQKCCLCHNPFEETEIKTDVVHLNCGHYAHQHCVEHAESLFKCDFCLLHRPWITMHFLSSDLRSDIHDIKQITKELKEEYKIMNNNEKNTGQDSFFN